LAQANQKLIYALRFDCAVATLKTFGRNDKQLAAELAMTVILHTHSRQLDYHPHVHLIVPGGGVGKRPHSWKKVNGKYLFNGRKLAAVFKGKLLCAIETAGLKAPQTPKQWVAQCKHVGRGLPALKYLSRYLYRGVISNDRIIRDDGDFITFEYVDADSGTTKTRRLRGEDFINLILQHTLPKGFRRARDFGWLHGNAKKRLRIIQWVLRVAIPKPYPSTRPKFICDLCHAVMVIVGFSGPKPQPG